MKTKTTIIIALFLLMTNIAFSQAPNSFKYQSMIRKTDGSALANQTVNVKTSILKGSTSGDIVYSEVNSVSSNSFGIISFNIGEGSNQNGSISNIDWSNNSYFVKIEIDETGGSNYSLSSVSQLLSVPYALNANSVNSIDWTKVQNKPILFSGSFNDLSDKPNLITKSQLDSSLNSLIVDTNKMIIDFVPIISTYGSYYGVNVVDNSKGLPVNASIGYSSDFPIQGIGNGQKVLEYASQINGDFYIKMEVIVNDKKYNITKLFRVTIF